MKMLKFRVWDKVNKKMIDALELTSEGYKMRFNLEERTSDDIVWLQFTGLHDKNGKEIYEGDIINDWEGNDCVVTWIFEWGMYASLFSHEYSNYKSHCIDSIDETMFWTFPIENKEASIIGNIYENPELL